MPPLLDLGLQGHVALVTGANHGIGAATALILASHGAAVVVSYLRIPDPGESGGPEAYRRSRAMDAEQVLTAIAGKGGRAIALEADLEDVGSPTRLFDAAEAAFGPVDILINNATGWRADTFWPTPHGRFGHQQVRVSPETIDQQFAVDARATALLISELARRHAARGARWGRIVGLTSGGALGFPNEVSYGAAKAALENYTMAAAFELAPLGITANVVHPPVTDTGWVTDEVRRHVKERPDLIHIASPDDVARVIVYLASDEAGLITGNRLHLR
jgi:3-oxoacyl-[acyl-carrier protein] reductase